MVFDRNGREVRNDEMMYLPFAALAVFAVQPGQEHR
jgi:hypothetical protein